MPVSYTHLDVYKRQSIPGSSHVGWAASRHAHGDNRSSRAALRAQGAMPGTIIARPRSCAPHRRTRDEMCIRDSLLIGKRPLPLMVPASYHILERATGVEPASSAWKAEVLPMNYARVMWSGRQDSNLRHPAPKAGALPDCATSRRLGQPGSNARASQGASDYRGIALL